MPPGTTAQIQITANSSQLPLGLRRALSMVSGFAQGVSAMLSKMNLAPNMFGPAGKGGKPGAGIMTPAGVIKRAAGALVGNLAVRGMDTIVDEGKKVWDFNKRLVEFGIAARSTPLQLKEIARASRQTAADIGVGADSVLAGGKAYSDLAGAEEFTIDKMNILARAARASKSEASDLAGMMYQLTRSMHVADGEMENTIGGLINQAKDGGIEAKQMAAEFAGLLPLFSKFDGAQGRKGAVEIGAAFQITRDGFNSASEAGTGLQRVLVGLRTYASRFEKAGVKVNVTDANGVKHARAFGEILEDIGKSKLMKDPELLKKAFGRQEGWRTVELLLGNVKRLKDLVASGMVNGVIPKDLATVTESDAGRIDIAFEKMRNSIAAAVTPERIEAFVSAIEGLTDKVGPLVEMVGKFADIMGGIYEIGKKVRGTFSGPYLGKLAQPSIGDIKATAKNNGISELEAVQKIQRDHEAKVKAYNDIKDAIVDDKTTQKSDRLAIAAAFPFPGEAGVAGRRSIGSKYLEDTGMSLDRRDKLIKELQQQHASDIVDAAQRKASVSAIWEFNQAVSAVMAPAIAKAVSEAMVAAPAPQLHVDGKHVATAVHNSTDRRRKP
jgi:hypothetical protein